MGLYLLLFSVPCLQQAGPTWQLETMSAARVMPDTVLLPDGTLFVCNGGTVGIAGGTSGAGESTSNGMPQAGNVSLAAPVARVGMLLYLVVH